MNNLTQRNRDLGLQPERTSLSWRRTLFVLLINALLMFKVGLGYDSWLLLMISSITLTTVGVSYFLIRYRSMNYWHNTDFYYLSPDWLKQGIGLLGILAALGYGLFILLNHDYLVFPA